MTTNDIDNISAKMPKSGFDSVAYEGKRVKIARVEKIQVINKYTGPNGAYNAAETEAKTWKIEIETESLPKLDADGNFTTDLYVYHDELEGKDKHITVTARFGLSQDEAGEWVISKHPKAKLWKFMRKMGVEKLSQLLGKHVTLITEPSTDQSDDRSYLRIAI